MIHFGYVLLLILTLTLNFAARAAEVIHADVCVYGGTSAGVIAAAAVAKEGRTVVLVEPGAHFGGMSSGGLGETDIGNKMVIGGMSRDFYRAVGKTYGQAEAWKFEPHVAEKVFNDLIAKFKLKTLLQHRLVQVEKEGAKIVRITLENTAKNNNAEKIQIEAAVFIDAGYEGDLMAQAKVKYHVGREATKDYDEPLDGIRAHTPSHQFGVHVDPYKKPGDAESGLIPLIQPGDGGAPGDGDARVQSYNFRLCLTQNEKIKIPLKAPENYDPQTYELFARFTEALVAAKKPVKSATFLKIDMMPNGKTDINNNGAVSTDFIGQSWKYPEAGYEERAQIWKAHEDYIKGLLYFMQTSPRLPETFRTEMQKWGLCSDEFTDTGCWPHQLYVREARRMTGRYVVTQADCVHKTVIADSVGMAAYNMDSHNCQRFVKSGSAINEGDVQVAPSGPYPVGYGAITPKAEECTNLIVPVCLSATHIAYGSIRMEPVFMVLGESAALAACQAIIEKKSVQEIDVPRLQKRLLEAGQVLEFKKK